MNIHLMYNTDSFVLTTTEAATIADLLVELEISSEARTTVNINGTVVGNDTPLYEGALVAIVAKDKKGGK